MSSCTWHEQGKCNIDDDARERGAKHGKADEADAHESGIHIQVFRESAAYSGDFLVLLGSGQSALLHGVPINL